MWWTWNIEKAKFKEEIYWAPKETPEKEDKE
jgi:hypothetical protein